MNKIRSLQFAVLIISLFNYGYGFSCSMYKITVGDKTMVGCNEDAWRVTSKIWFENGTPQAAYGAAFTGSRFDGNNGYAPQSGMNEFGLVFSRLASRAPENKPAILNNKKKISNPTPYLKNILHTCKNVDDVFAYISQYDHSYFLEDVFIYIDKSGKYLVVEPYVMTIGNDSKYVLSNFCPSATDQQDALKVDRYRNGVIFLKNKIDTTLSFCTALSDTMHVCREKIGDGTLLTSIWDPKNGNVNLYFYHQYKNTVKFNLKTELAKGDHMLDVPALFPRNAEFEKLAQYKIPQNTPVLMCFLFFSGTLFFFSSIFFLIALLRRRTRYVYVQMLLFPLGLIMLYYSYVLFGNINIFYFTSPYKDPHNIFVSLSSYLPFLLLFLIVPLLVFNGKIWKENAWGLFPKCLFTLNNVVYIILTGLFVYWGLFDVFH